MILTIVAILLGLLILYSSLKKLKCFEKWSNMRWGNVAFHPRRGRPPYFAPDLP